MHSYRNIVDICSHLLAHENYVLLLRISHSLEDEDGLRSSNDLSLGSTEKLSWQVFQEQLGVLKAQAFYSFGLLDHTWDVLKGVLEINPNNIPSFYLIAQVYIQRGWPDKALSILDRLEEYVSDHKVHSMLTQQCIDIKKYGHIPIHKEAQQIINSTSIPDLLTLVRQFLVIGKRNIAEKVLLKAYQVNPHDKNVCNFIWALKGDYSSRASLLELLSKAEDFLHQTEATTPLSSSDIPSVDTEIFLRSLSFENEQNYVEEELHDEDTDETHFEDQTNVFTSEFTAELTSMVDENPYEKDHSDQSDENIGLGFLFKGIEQDEFLANDGLTSTVSAEALESLQADESTLHTKRVDIVYLDDSFEQSEHSVSVVIDEDSQAFSLISPKEEHISTPQVNVISKTPKNMVRKSPNSKSNTERKAHNNKIKNTPHQNNVSRKAQSPKNLSQNKEPSPKKSASLTTPDKILQFQRYGIIATFVCILVAFLFIFSQMVLQIEPTELRITSDNIISTDYKSIRERLSILEEKYSETDSEYKQVQLLRAWLFFENDFNPTELQKLKEWRDSTEASLGQTEEWIAMDVILSMSSIYEEQDMSEIQPILLQVRTKLLELRKRDIPIDLFNTLMFKFIILVKNFKVQGLDIDDPDNVVADFNQYYAEQTQEHLKNNRQETNLYAVLFSNDLDYVQHWLDQNNSKESAEGKSTNSQSVVLHRKWISFIKNVTLQVVDFDQVFDEEYELSTTSFGNQRKSLTFILQSLPRSEVVLERNINRALKISNNSIFTYYVSTLSLQMKYQQSNNEEQLKNILSFSRECRLYHIDCFTVELLHGYLHEDMSFLEEANIHDWQEDVIQNIKRGRVSKDTNLGKVILTHYFTGNWSQYRENVLFFKNNDIYEDLQFTSPILYSLDRDMSSYNEKQSSSKNDSDFLESTKEISNIGKMILLENAIKNKEISLSEGRATLQELNTRTKERNSKTSVRTMKLEQMLFNSQKWNSQIKKKALHFKNITD